MKLRTRVAGRMWLLDLEGELRLGDGDLALRRAVEEMLEAGNHRLVINLAGVSNADSAGIGELVFSKKRALAAGGDVRLLSPQQRVREALMISRLDEVFEIFTDESQALVET